MLEVKDVTIRLGSEESGFSLRNINFSVQDGEYFVLLGPTGSGKTVLMESIAGLNSVDSGKIMINGRDVTRLSLHERRIGFAYQDYAIYGHLSVRDNISFGLMWVGKRQKEIDQAIDRAVELLGIQNLLDKRPRSLSGGESQKVCLARAIALKPDLLLLDEPLCSVDAHAKEAAQEELRELHDRLKLTTIHVTHDFQEALALGTHVAVMTGGRIEQIGTPADVFRHPQSDFVARFLMTRNIFEGEVQHDAAGQNFSVDGMKIGVATTLTGPRHASVRPEDIWISRERHDSDSVNSLPGTLTTIADRGSFVYITVDLPPKVTCLVLPRSLEEMGGLSDNEKIFVNFKRSAVNVF